MRSILTIICFLSYKTTTRGINKEISSITSRHRMIYFVSTELEKDTLKIPRVTLTDMNNTRGRSEGKVEQIQNIASISAYKNVFVALPVIRLFFIRNRTI